MEGKVYFGRFVCIGSSVCQLPISRDKNVLFQVQWTGGTSSQEIYALLLGRKEAVREPFLNLVFLNCLHLKITNTPKWHIGRWHVLNPSGVLASSCFPGLFPCPHVLGNIVSMDGPTWFSFY